MRSSTREQNFSELALRFFSNASLYGLGMVLVRFGNLLVLPVYWGLLNPQDFGIITATQIVSQLLASILDLGISGSIQRLFWEWKKEERPFHLAAVWSFSFSYSLIVCVFLSFFSSQIGHLYESDLPNSLVLFAIWTAFFQNFGVIPGSLFRIREQMKLFSIIAAVQFISQTFAALIFIYFLRMGPFGYLLGSLIGAVFYGLACFWYSLRQLKFPWKWHHLREALFYALPTFPAALIEGLGNTLDRVFLQKYVPLSELGLYGLARQFGVAYSFFAGILKSSWIPLTYRIVIERKDASIVLGRMSGYYFLVLALPATFFSITVGDLIGIINEPDYFGVVPYIPFFVLSALITGIGHIHGRGIDLAKKTQFYWVMYAAQLAVNVSLLYILAPRFGAWGAVISVVFSVLARELIQVGLGYYFFPRPIEFGPILWTVFFQGLAILASLALSSYNYWINFLMKLVTWSAISLMNLIFVLGAARSRTLFSLIFRMPELLRLKTTKSHNVTD